MQREVKKYLLDIQIAINSIYDYLGENRNFENYASNKLLRRAVERELEIIGEATGKLLKLEPEIPIIDARRIVNLRNWVIHSYDNVDDAIIWGIINKSLPPLKIQVDTLMQSTDE
jgi:uncharacterized protein with HEPN domain